MVQKMIITSSIPIFQRLNVMGLFWHKCQSFIIFIFLVNIVLLSIIGNKVNRRKASIQLVNLDS